MLASLVRASPQDGRFDPHFAAPVDASMDDWQAADELIERGIDLYHRGRWCEAEASFRRALESDPLRGDWQFNLGLTLDAAGRDLEAIECFRRSIELLPEAIDPHLAAASIELRHGHHEAALGLLEAACAIDPECETAHASRIRCLGALGRPDAAEAAYFEVQQRLDHYPNCLAAIGEVLLERGQLPRAGWCFREALRQDSTIPGARAKWAEVLARRGQTDRALQLFLQELREDPGSIETLLAYGSLLADLNRAAEASEKFRRVLELEPGHAEAHWRLGELARRCNRLADARAAFEIAIELDPRRADGLLQLGEVRLRCGDLDAARAALRRQSEQLRPMDPSAALVATRTADLLLEAGDPASAAALLRRQFGRMPRDPQRLRLLAFASFRSGDLGEGSALSRRLRRIDPTCVVAIHNLGLAALQQDRLGVAWGWWRRGVRREPLDEGLQRLQTHLIVATAITRLQSAGRVAVGVAQRCVGAIQSWIAPRR